MMTHTQKILRINQIRRDRNNCAYIKLRKLLNEIDNIADLTTKEGESQALVIFQKAQKISHQKFDSN